MHFIVTSSLHLRKESQRLVAMTELLTALDYLGHALQAAPSNMKLWKKKEGNLLIWHDNDQNCDVGICQIKNKIWRISGTYSLFKQAWSSKKKSLLAKNIKELSFVFNEASIHAMPHLCSVTCSLTSEADSIDLSNSVKKTMLLENRALS
jgi:hypothetical protein